MGKVLFQTDDSLNEGNLSEWINHDNLVGYAQDVVINANFVDDVVQVDPALVWIRDGSGVYTIKPDEATLDLPDSNGENFVYGVFDADVQDSAAWEVAASEEDVPRPSVIVAVIDTGVESVTKRNTAPDVDVGSVTAETASVESEPTADTDVVRKAEADAKADLPIETDDLSDDAVTAAKIAAAAVDSDSIDENAVGVSELMDALGTDDETPIPETTHFESFDVGDANLKSGSITDDATAADDIPRFAQVTEAGASVFFQFDEPDPELEAVWFQKSIDVFEDWESDTLEDDADGGFASDGNRVFFAATTTDKFYSVDIDNGSIDWTFTAPDIILESGVEYFDGRVFFCSLGSQLIALDSETGNEEWTKNLQDNNELADIVEINGSIILGDDDGNVYSIEPSDGSENWSTLFDGFVVESGFAETQGRVCLAITESGGIPEESKFIALDESTGAVEAEVNLLNQAETGVAASEGVGYVTSEGDTDGRLFAIDVADSSIVWEKSLNDDFIRKNVVLQDDVVYTANNSETVFAFDAETGDLIWQNDSSDAISSGPVLINDVLAVIDDATDGLTIISKGGQLLEQSKEYSNVSSSLWSLDAIGDSFVFGTGVETVVKQSTEIDGYDGIEISDGVEFFSEVSE